MKLEIKLVFLVMGLFLGLSPARAEHESDSANKRYQLEESSVTCGDHWFKMKLIWASGSIKGKVFFSGDSRPERDSVNVKVTEKSGSLVAQFEDDTGGEILLEGIGTDSLSATIRDSGKASALPISPCYRTK